MGKWDHYLGNGVTVDLQFLADDLADDLSDADLLEFILAVDSRKADFDFTVYLRDALTRAIDNETE